MNVRLLYASKIILLSSSVLVSISKSPLLSNSPVQALQCIKEQMFWVSDNSYWGILFILMGPWIPVTARNIDTFTKGFIMHSIEKPQADSALLHSCNKEMFKARIWTHNRMIQPHEKKWEISLLRRTTWFDMVLKQTLTIKEFIVRKCSPHSLQKGKTKIADHTYSPEMVPMLSFLYLLFLPQPENCNTYIPS